MVKVFLSPSDQGGNTYASGSTNEMEQCRRIADACEAELNTYNSVEVKNNQTDGMAGRVSESNKWAASVHVCIHTNASTNGTNGKAGGTRVFYYADGTTGEQISLSVFRQLAPLTDGSDKCLPYPDLYEVKRTTAPCVYIEVEFHDNKEQAEWIIKNVDKIGKAIATGIAEYFKLTKKVVNDKTFTLTINKADYDRIVIDFE